MRRIYPNGARTSLWAHLHGEEAPFRQRCCSTFLSLSIVFLAYQALLQPERTARVHMIRAAADGLTQSCLFLQRSARPGSFDSNAFWRQSASSAGPVKSGIRVARLIVSAEHATGRATRTQTEGRILGVFVSSAVSGLRAACPVPRRPDRRGGSTGGFRTAIRHARFKSPVSHAPVPARACTACACTLLPDDIVISLPAVS
jgi:hypothetical protein